MSNRRNRPVAIRKPIGGPSCGKHAVPGAFAFRRVFDRDQGRSTPFAAKPDPLHEAQSGKRQRRENARACVGRQRADQRRREPHGQHGRDECRFASDAIAEMAEQERADGPREKGEAEGQIGVESLRLGRRFREEHRPEHERRRGAEDIEVVELDRRADEAGERDLADACAPRFVCLRSRYCCHHCLSDGFSRAVSRPAKSLHPSRAQNSTGIAPETYPPPYPSRSPLCGARIDRRRSSRRR